MCIHTDVGVSTLTTATDLSAEEMAALQALGDACNYSLSAHVPIQAIRAKFRINVRRGVQKYLDKIRAKGLCAKHPTGRNTTWQLTRNGLNILRECMQF
jgi:predicted transcriptional regulator